MPEIRLIEVNTLKDKISNTKLRAKSPEMMAGLVEMKAAALREIENAQTVEAEPVRHGRWIDKGEYAVCTECGGRSGTQYDGVEPIPLMTQFCPNCGAKMNGGYDND